jgi:type II secretory ATPase GspE/PulE/Tfp pilus assembly ATPase PilB-like protein
MIGFSRTTEMNTTTTIYSILKEQPARRINIITGECPIDAVLPDITQDELVEEGRYTFSDFVRLLLRCQPCIRLTASERFRG